MAKFVVEFNACPAGTTTAVTKKVVVEAESFDDAERKATEGYHILSWATAQRACNLCGDYPMLEDRWGQAMCGKCRKPETKCRCKSTSSS